MSNFAVITHYNDIKKAIEDKPEFVFKYEEETNTYVVKYNLLLAGSFDHEDENVRKLLLEARGITFDADTGEVVSRKFHKFFNIGEKPSSQIGNIDFSKRHWIMQKLDGSAIHNVKRRNNPVTKAGRSDVAKMVDIWFSKENYKKFNKFCESNNWTASYEFCSLRQRIVVEYKEENLVLTAVRDNITGEYIYDPDELKEIGKEYDIPVVDSYLVTDQKIEDIISETRNAEGIEGYVVRFEDGSMYKIKSDEYIRFHNAVSRIKQEKDIVKIILNDELDDILPILSEHDSKEIREFADNVIEGIKTVTNEILYFAIHHYKDNQKDFALSILETEIGKKYGQFILGKRTMFDGYDNVAAWEMIYDALFAKIMKESSTGTRLENVRWMFGGHRYGKIWVDE